MRALPRLLTQPGRKLRRLHRELPFLHLGVLIVKSVIIPVYRRSRFVAAIFVILVLVTAQTFATQPARFNYQAKLTNTSGVPLQGPHTLFLSLWEGGTSGAQDSGTKRFAETAAVTASDGIVNHAVGTGSNTFGGTLSETMFATSNEIFLQVAVDTTSSVVLPRTRLESVPFAIQSLSAANGLPAGFLTLSTSSVAPSGFSATGSTLFNNWVKRAPMITSRDAMGLATVDGKLYAIGGGEGVTGDFSRLNERYDPANNSWTTRSLMITNRGGLTCDEVNGVIYAVGGVNTTVPPALGLTSNEAYDPVANSWALRQPLTVGRLAHASAVANGLLYVFGGSGDNFISTVLNSVEAYNPLTNLWTAKAAMPTARFGAVAGNINGTIYVVGGSSGPSILATNEAYDPVANSWVAKAPLPLATYVSAGAVAGGKLYVFGGVTLHGPSSPGSDMWVYEPLSNTWSLGVPLGEGRFFNSAAVANGKIYTAGGNNETTITASLEELSPGTFYLYSKN